MALSPRLRRVLREARLTPASVFRFKARSPRGDARSFWPRTPAAGHVAVPRPMGNSHARSVGRYEWPADADYSGEFGKGGGGRTEIWMEDSYQIGINAIRLKSTRGLGANLSGVSRPSFVARSSRASPLSGRLNNAAG